MTWATTALVFPGQGSQVAGMGRDLAANYPAAKAVFDEADHVLGYALSRLCFEGPEAVLNDTANTQPALYVTGIAALRALESVLPQAAPGAVAGHSLGELTALTAAGALSFAAGLRLVQARGRLMKQAGELAPGAMAALLGAEIEAAHGFCEQASAETGRPVVVANDNCPGQVVISGDLAALEAALDLAKAAGLRKAVRLDVSIAAHSPLMAAVQAEFREHVAATAIMPPQVAVYGNISAAPLTDAAAIRAELGDQLTQPVRWRESVQAMLDAGLRVFVEMGAGDVLTKLLKRIDRSAPGVGVYDAASLQAFADRTAGG